MLSTRNIPVDVYFHLSGLNRYWVIPETAKGRKWMFKLFGTESPQYIDRSEIDSYVNSAKQEFLQVEVE